MKIGILGSRGIPNNYGGFEQFAEYVSKDLVKLGYEVYVYSSHNHIYKEKKWRGVNIIRKYNPEHRIGILGQFVYDLLCILSTRKQKFDIILQLGYTSNSIWGRLLPKDSIIVTNMDGLEWKRSKYKLYAKYFLKWAEKMAVHTSDYLIADSICIQKYISEKYLKKEVLYIPYGAEPVRVFDESILENFGLESKNYYILVARIEPENNIDLILSAFVKAKTNKKFIVVGNTKLNAYGKHIGNKYTQYSNVKFIGGVYDIQILNMLRHHAIIYFHGHSVGGTNPSLLEAMASNVFVAFHDNDFNRAIIGDDGVAFTSELDIIDIIQKEELLINQKSLDNNFQKIEQIYNWTTILNTYDTFFKKITK